MVAYPASSIPTEILFSVPTIGNNQENNLESDASRQSAPREVPNVYMIRDKDHICDLHLKSQHVAPGADVHIHLDFADCHQPCSLVRATVMQSETRPDGSRIQVGCCCIVYFTVVKICQAVWYSRKIPILNFKTYFL